jgi:DNA-binding CsgD family transcriptional regulator
MADTPELQTALRTLRRASGLPVTFASTAAGGGRMRIVQLSGTVTQALRGLDVAVGTGLGGKAAALARPLAVSDYRTARTISHEYDHAVGAERLGPVLAVPVVVHRATRAVLYGALREPAALGDRALDAAVVAARELGQALAVQDARRQAERWLPAPRSAGAGGPAALEDIRVAHGELQALAREVRDPLLTSRLLAVCARLARVSTVEERPPADPGVPLSPRELDVLACIATGATNAAAGVALGLRPETVKSYLRSAMRKLDAHTRMEAVVAARRAGLLPYLP